MIFYLITATLLFALPAVARIPEIADLKANTLIPEALIKKHPINEIAESLVLRRHAHHENSRGSIDYAGQSEIFLSFNSAHTGSIIKDQEFFNAHQIAQGATFQDDLKHREQLEDELIGIKLNGHHSLRPKYAYLEPKNLKPYPLTTYNPNYGNIFAKLNDRVKSRSTFTIGDSMDEGRDTVHTFRFKNSIELTYPHNKIPYWEAQIWGQLKLSDIDYFLVNCPKFPKASLSDMKTLLKSGKKVYFCSLNDQWQEMKIANEVTSKDLNHSQFLAESDVAAPKISDFNFKKRNKKLQVSFLASDNIGVNYCLVKVFHQQKTLLDDEISIRDSRIKSKNCQFDVPNPAYPLEIKIYVKDWYTNQATLTKTIE